MRRVDLCVNHGDTSVSDKLCCFKKEEEEEEDEGQIVSSGDSLIKRVLDRLATLKVPSNRLRACV